MKFNPPRKLESSDDLNSFDCGSNSLNHWLKKWALQNNTSGGTQTSVVTNSRGEVVAFFSLVMGEVQLAKANSKLKKNSSHYPIPILKITRMAVEKNYQKSGLGQAMVKFIMQKSIEISQTIGCKAIIVDPIDDSARSFYLRMQFKNNSFEENFMYITIADIAKNL